MSQRSNLEAAMLQSSLDCIIAIDHAGRILEFNPAAERTFGWRRVDVLGQEMAALIIPERLRGQHRAGLARYQATGSGQVLDRRIEMAAVRADGTEFPVELTITRVAGKGPAVFTGYLRDITDRKRAERRRATELAVTRVLAEVPSAEEGTLGILRAVSDTLGWEVGAVWTVDSAAGVLKCGDFLASPATPVTAFEAETRARTFAPQVGLPGRVWATATPAWISDLRTDQNFPRAPSAVADGLRSAFAFPLHLHGEVVGVIEFFSKRMEPPDADLLAAMGTIGGHVGQFVERKRAEAALRDADRRKDEFLAMLAHELRNPLAPISAAAAILQRMPADPTAVLQSRAIIDRQLALLVRLVDDLLDMSRLTLKKIEVRPLRIPLASVLSQAIETSASAAEAGGRRLSLHAPADIVWIQADLPRMIQVVSNLINNALKYTRVGGRIVVSGKRLGDHAVIAVEDDGAGIASELLPRIFDPFTGDEGRSPSSGLGIGLTIVKNLVELHGGTVTVESEVGRGTCFTITLPLAASRPSEEQPHDHLEVRSAARRRRVLIADDNTDAADGLTTLLTGNGHDVRTAYDGQTALSLAREFRPDAALLDLGLPVMDGYELARAIRDLPGGTNVLLVAVTGWGQNEDRLHAAAAGFDHYLVKPADPAMIERLLWQYEGMRVG